MKDKRKNLWGGKKEEEKNEWQIREKEEEKQLISLYAVHCSVKRFWSHKSSDPQHIDHDRQHAGHFNSDTTSLQKINFMPRWNHLWVDQLFCPAITCLRMRFSHRRAWRSNKKYARWQILIHACCGDGWKAELSEPVNYHARTKREKVG